MVAGSEDDSVSGYCGRCGRHWYFIGCDARRIVKLIRKFYGAKLCDLCREADDRGFYAFSCAACARPVEGAHDDVRDLLNVCGQAYCKSCMQSFYGIYDTDNPALAAVLSYVPPKKQRPWRTVAEWEALQVRAKEETRYQAQVRNLSRSQLRKNPQLINPQGHPIGRSGVPGAHHLDHIVPVGVCWAHDVPVADAASPRNLQVIPWILNTRKNGMFDVKRMVGWPGC